MGITIATTRVACNTATGTQDITTTDLGGLTPKAALFLISRATADNTAVDGASVGWGVTDGTISACMTAEDQHAQGTSNSNRKGTNVPVLIMDGTAASVVDGQASFSAWITNGVTINWTDAPASAYLLTAVFFAGSDLSAYCNFVDVATEDTGVDITTVGFESDIVITLLYDRNGGGSANANFGMGFIHNDRAGTVVQHTAYLRARDAIGTTDNSVQTRNDMAFAAGGNSDAAIYYEVSSFDSSGFTVTPRHVAAGNPGNNDLAYLALRLGTGPVVDSKVYTFSTPTGTGNSTDTNPGFTPQAVFYITDLVETVNSFITDANAGSIGVSVITSTAQYHNTISTEDNAGTSNTQCLTDDQAVNLPLHDGTAGMAATYSAFTGSGLTLNWSDVESAAKIWVALAIEAEGGTEYTQSVSGAVTPAGALARQTNRGLTGTVEPAGSVVRQGQKVLTGALAPTGALIRETQKVLTGALAPLGGLVRQTNKVLTGEVTPSGVVAAVRTIIVSLTGTLGLAGDLVRQTGKVLTGAVTPTGTLNRQTAKVLTGVVGIAGGLTRQTNKVLTGVLTAGGTLSAAIVAAANSLRAMFKGMFKGMPK